MTPILSDNYLYGKTVDPNKTKELKVKLPVSVHMRLHGMKILGDKSISATVSEALDAYFAVMDAERGVDTHGAPGAVETPPAVAHPNSPPE